MTTGRKKTEKNRIQWSRPQQQRIRTASASPRPYSRFSGAEAKQKKKKKQKKKREKKKQRGVWNSLKNVGHIFLFVAWSSFPAKSNKKMSKSFKMSLQRDPRAPHGSKKAPK